MKILLLTLGSHGDIHPFIAIGGALQRRGHQAILATNPYFREQIEASGVGFDALTEAADLRRLISENKVMDPLWGPLVVLRKLTLPEVPKLVQRTRELIRAHRPDVVVIHPIVIGASWACEMEGRPATVSIAPSPLIWGNPNDPLVMIPGRSDSPGPLTMAMDRFIGTWFLRLALDPGLNRVRRQLGLPAGRDHFKREATGADLNLGVWSPVLRAPMAGDPAGSAITGFTWHDRDHTQQTPDAELEAFMKAGPAPVVFALGSTGVHASGRFYDHAVEASRRLGVRALLVVGKGQEGPRGLAPGGPIKAVQYAPFSVVFPGALAAVHHGGAGTTAQGLRSGRPTLITPMAHDQFDNAARVRRLGAGETLAFSRVSAGRLEAALRKVIGETRYARGAAALAGRIGSEDGAERAAELIEGLAAKQA